MHSNQEQINEYNEYLSHFPIYISEDINKYIIDEVLKSSRYIFTRKEGKQQYGYCTHCMKEFKTEGLKHNNKINCSNCKSECKVKASGMGRKNLRDEAYFVYYEKSVKNPEIIVARGIYVLRDYSGDYHNAETQYSTMRWYIFETGNSLMFRRASYWERSNTEKEYIKCSKVHSLYNDSSLSRLPKFYSRKSIEEALKDTSFKYSTWERYDYEDMTEFFYLYSKYPGIEYLTKEGYKNIVEEKLGGYATYRTINWRGKDIFKILKVTKQELREIKAQKIHVTFSFLKVFQDAKKQNWGLTVEQITKIAEEYNYNYDSLVKLTQYSTMKKLIKYFSKQYKEYNNNHYYSESYIITTFRDYIADCKKLGMDIKSERVLFPKDLYTAHQNTIKQIKASENKELDILISKRVKELKEYEFKNEYFLIRPAASTKELIEESAALHHCVASNYTKPYANGSTNIFFVRKIIELEKPYCTVEVSGGQVIQARIKDNKLPDEVTQEFIKAFTEVKLSRKKKNRAKVPA